MLYIVLITLGLWTFVTEPAPLALLAATLVLAWPAGRRLADRLRCPKAAAVSFVIAVGVVLALTLTPDEPVAGFFPALPPHYLSLLVHNPAALWSQFIAAPADAEQAANIALYLPVGLLARFVWRRTVRASAFGMALTVAIETCQYGIIGRAGSLTDIRNNTVGAILGAVLGALAVHVLSGATGSRALSDPAGKGGGADP